MLRCFDAAPLPLLLPLLIIDAAIMLLLISPSFAAFALFADATYIRHFAAVDAATFFRYFAYDNGQYAFARHAHFATLITLSRARATRRYAAQLICSSRHADAATMIPEVCGVVCVWRRRR